jgi:hypothetical protein
MSAPAVVKEAFAVATLAPIKLMIPVLPPCVAGAEKFDSDRSHPPIGMFPMHVTLSSFRMPA